MKLDFGTYHHASKEESEGLRGELRDVFSSLLPTLFPPDLKINVLDAGCGLGFLSSIVGRVFRYSSVTGIDTFQDGSLAGSSIERAERNMKLLGLDDRVKFFKHNLVYPLPADWNFDLIISNLVFHNMGKKRFDGYRNVFAALKSNGYFVVGDLFPYNSSDDRFFRSLSTTEKEIMGKGSGRWQYRIKVLRKI